MKTFTLKEVSKKINVPAGKLRQWEKDLDNILEIPRTKQGARIYTETEINLLLEIKELLANKFSKEMIRESIQKKIEPVNQETKEPETVINKEPIIEVTPEPIHDVKPEPILDKNSEDENSSIAVVAETISPKEVTVIQNGDQFFDAMDTYKQTFLNEVKEEIRNVLRKEVVEEVKREIKNGSYITVKTLSDSIYKSSENTKAEIEHLTEHLEAATERNTERLQYITDSIAHASVETSEEIFTLSKQLSESTEALSHYVDMTNNEILTLTEAIERDRDLINKEREQFRHEIRQREVAFQDMLSSFRDVAAAKEKKWWKFWT
nr:MerR family transcriptional regulator [Neobacillus sp. Marseille-Q6967]